MVFTRRKKIIASVAVAMVAVIVLAGVLSEYGAVSAKAIQDYGDYKKSFISEDESSWTKLENNETDENKKTVIDNNRFTLTMNLKTTHFVVTEKQMGTVYESYPLTPPNLLSEDDKARVNSNLSIAYYDSSSKIHYFGAYNDSVSKNQFSVYQKGNKLRIIYTLGSAANDLLTPQVITQKTMEEKIIPALRASEKVKIKLYYKLYSKTSRPEDYDSMMKKYPSLKDQSAYILTSDVTEQILNEVSKLMLKSGLTKESAQQEMASLGVTESSGNLPAGFTVPLELELNNNGFTAKVLTDRITENNAVDKLAQVYLLEYFGAKGEQEDGFILVPDGSGAEIKFNQPAPKTYSQHFYNDDLLISSDTEQQLSRNVPLPYFGIACKSGSFFATVEGGAGVGNLVARTTGQANPLNMVTSYFDLRAIDKTDVGQDRNIPTLNVYNKHIVYEHPTVTYTLLSYSEQLLSDMAQVYRNQLLKTDGLDTLQLTKQDVPLYLDFLCLSTAKLNVLGVSTPKQVVMSTLSEITNVVKTLHQAGITNLQIRLKGWNEQGLVHDAFNRCKLSKKVGTEEELKQLQKLLTDKGGKLYLDTNFTFAAKNSSFDQLALSRDTSRNLESAVVSLKEFDRVTLQKAKDFRQGFVISPYSYMTFVNSFLKEYSDKSYQNLGLSWSTGGMYLLGDYNKKTDLDMAYASSVVGNVFAELKDAAGGAVMTDYGYDYTLPYVDSIVNTPLTSSYFTAETASLPFMQMVLSGIKNMSGPALNFKGTRMQLIEMSSTAAAPYYMLMTENNDVLRELDMQETYYSLDYRMHISDILKDYSNYNKTVKSVYGEEITGFRWVNNSVSCTTFQNGKEIWANRSSTEQTISNMVLKPYSYELKG